MQSALGDASGDLLALCRALSAVAAPSGNEDRLTAAIAGHVSSGGLEPIVDRLGQVAVALPGRTGDGPVIFVSAHLDELGLTVRGIEDDGMLRVHRLGGVPERVLPGLRLAVHTRNGDLPAVVGLKSHHLTPPEEKYVARPATGLYLDIGAVNARETRAAGVRVGDPVTYQPQWDDLPNGRFSGKALDDRLGVAAVLGLLDRLAGEPPPTRTIVAFTTLEEFHLRSTLALVARFAPDIVVNVDIAPAADTPDLRGEGAVALGGGAALSRLSFHGRGTLGGLIPHPGLVRAVEETASAADIPLQYDAMVGVINDAAFVPMATADGIAAVGVGIPVRYTHSPIETGQLSDVSACIDLLTESLPRLAAADLSRGATQIARGGIA